MTAEKIRDRISELCTLFGFEFNGKTCDVDPFSDAYFNLNCDGDTLEVHSIDEVMNTPFFDGKALFEIADIIDITEW